MESHSLSSNSKTIMILLALIMSQLVIQISSNNRLSNQSKYTISHINEYLCTGLFLIYHPSRLLNSRITCRIWWRRLCRISIRLPWCSSRSRWWGWIPSCRCSSSSSSPWWEDRTPSWQIRCPCKVKIHLTQWQEASKIWWVWVDSNSKWTQVWGWEVECLLNSSNKTSKRAILLISYESAYRASISYYVFFP